MQWILEHFQLVIILVGAFLVWLKGLFERKMAERQERENPPDNGDDGRPWEYGDEAVEAPVVMPPPLPRTAAEAGTGPAPAPERRQRHRPGTRRESREARVASAAASAASAASRVTAESVRAAAASSSELIPGRLRQPAELRRAIVLREILGPPAGLR